MSPSASFLLEIEMTEEPAFELGHYVTPASTMCVRPVKKPKECAMKQQANIAIQTSFGGEDQKRYLKERVFSISADKRGAAKQKFGLADDDAPCSFKELLARIQAGLYLVDEKRDNQKYGMLHAVTWRDPAKARDYEGFGVWEDGNSAAEQKVMDDINILDGEVALASMRAYEAAE